MRVASKLNSILVSHYSCVFSLQMWNFLVGRRDSNPRCTDFKFYWVCSQVIALISDR